jgi:hypothetical protein
VDFHALRVTYTTLVIESGANGKEAQTMLCHTSPDMTMNIYSRTRQDSLPRLAERIGETLESRAECATSVQRATPGEEGPAVYPNEASGLRSSPQADGCGFDSRRLQSRQRGILIRGPAPTTHFHTHIAPTASPNRN